MQIAHKGFVLLTVLAFLQIFSLLGIYGLSAVVTAEKSNQQHWKNEIKLTATSHKMFELERQLVVTNSDCLRPFIDSGELPGKSRAWWKQNACIDSIGKDIYFYFVEFLGQDPCVIINKPDKNQPVPANYYRITLLGANENIHRPKILLQSIFVKSDDLAALCQEKARVVLSGVQSRRELN